MLRAALHHRLVAATVAVALTVFLPAGILADVITWSGPDGGIWDTTTANWTGGDTVYSDGDDVRFSGATAEYIVIQAGGVAPNSFLIPSGGGGFLAFTGGDITGATALTSGASGADAHFQRDGSYTFTGGLFAYGKYTYDPQLSSSGSTVHFGSDGGGGGGVITFSGGSFVFEPSMPATLDNSFVLSTDAGTLYANANATFASSVAMGADLKLMSPGVDYSGLSLNLDGDRQLTLAAVSGVTPPTVEWTGAATGPAHTLTINTTGGGVNAGAGFGGSGGWDVGNVLLTGARRVQFTGDGTTFFDQVTANGGKVTLVDARLIKTVVGTGGGGTLNIGFSLEVLAAATIEVTTANVVTDGRLSGDGNVLAPVNVDAGGTIAPGAAVGALAVGDLALAAGSTAEFEVDGLSADQLVVSGTVSLSGTLTILQINPPPAGEIVLIDNDGIADAVVGTFTAAPEGALISDDGGLGYVVSYVGGDGNDVTLTPAAGVCVPCGEYEATVLDATCEIRTASYADWHSQVEALITATIIAPVCDDGHPGGGSGTACADYLRDTILGEAACAALQSILGP